MGLAERLRAPAGVALQMGPFVVRIRARLRGLAEPLQVLYGDYPTVDGDGLADFHVSLERPRNLRGWVQPQALFKLDGRSLFEPFPEDTALPLFEWGLNYCVARRSHQYLMLHAAAVERGGRVLLLPAVPGSGKSTLCAALAHRGWRLFSDEFGLFDFKHRRFVGFPRPVALKNESIEVIRRFAPEAVFGPLFPKTRKGTVAHLRPPTAAVRRMAEGAEPGWIVFPKYAAGSPLLIRSLPKAQSFLRLAHNSFNYEITGADGFRAVGAIVRACECYELTYSDLEQAVAHLDRLTA